MNRKSNVMVPQMEIMHTALALMKERDDNDGVPIAGDYIHAIMSYMNLMQEEIEELKAEILKMKMR